ncbi:UNVERIFIED_CONTAM: hypothetical protein Slati_0893400 [Sesamum latifolium]|uniref:Reverse transcriptase zinc-binding domain-containing protein n=1 Tax=Sesamum latifolium TaxID=2727402 RepID=A0AAW2XNA7_9LAMI
MESIDITYALPTIHGGQDRVIWTGPRNSFSSAAAYDVFCPLGPKVEWSSLLVGSLKIPRHRFILWLAILGRLSTLDKPWLQYLAIRWASTRWRGRHMVNASYKALLASLIYHLWEERNRRIFQQTDRTPVIIARIIVDEIRDLIVSKNMSHSVSTRGLYRLWRIPWPVEGEAHT